MPDEDQREAALLRLLERCLADRRYANRRGGHPNRWTLPDRLKKSDEITDKELLVLTALSHGLTLVDTADVTGFNYEWCKDAMKNIKRKLGAKTRPQAVAIALRRGLIR